MLVLVRRVEPRASVRDRRLRERHRPSAGRHLDPAVDRERVDEMRVVPGDDEEAARRGVDDRRATDPVSSGRDVRGPHGQAGGLIERHDVGIRRPIAGNAKKRPALAAARRGLAPGGPRRAAGLRGPVLAGTGPTPCPGSACCRSPGTSRCRRTPCPASSSHGGRREARLGEGRAAEEVVASLKDRLRSARAAVSARAAHRSARSGSRLHPRSTARPGPGPRATPCLGPRSAPGLASGSTPRSDCGVAVPGGLLAGRAPRR